MPRARYLLVALVCVGTVWPGSAVSAQSVEIEATTTSPRTDAPFEFVAVMKWSGNSILSGHLELDLRSGEDIIHRLRSEHLTLSSGERRIRFLVPPMPPVDGVEPRYSIHVLARFHRDGEDARIDLLTHSLFPSQRDVNTRTLLVGVPIRPHGAENALRVAGHLHFDRDMRGSQEVEPPTRTRSVPILADAIPTSAISYCAYDLVAVGGDVLVSFEPPHLKALSDWIHGGGRLFFWGGAGLRSEHVDFLNELAGTDRFRVGEFGNLDGSAAAHYLDVGLGRAVVIESDLDPGDEDIAFTAYPAIQHLWSLREDPGDLAIQLHRRVSASKPLSLDQKPPPLRRVYPDGHELRSRIREAVPEVNVEPIPLSLILVVLAGFILVVGPIDYFLLGLVRARRLTWLLVAGATVACTGMVHDRTNTALANLSPGRTLTIVDVAPTGRILRQNRFAIHVSPRPDETRIELSNELFTWLPTSSWETADFTLEGSLPSRYEVRMQTRQWSPTFFRTLRLGTDPHPDIAETVEDLAIPWHELDPAHMTRLQSELREFQQRRLPRDSYICVFSPDSEARIPVASEHLPPGLFAALAEMPRASKRSDPLADPMALFAPTGSRNLLDVPLFPTEGRSGWLLCINVRVDDHDILFRCLYR